MTIRLSLLVSFSAATLCFAQSERGNIRGVVTDATGASVANAPVSITSSTTNISAHAVTSNAGEYTAPNLGPGVYRIEITAPGFRRFVADGVTLTAGTTIRMDAQLQLGQVTESIEVHAQAAQMKTEDAKITTAIENRMVDQLPLVVGGTLRNSFDLVSTAPEATIIGTTGAATTVLGGGQGQSFGATLDGLSVMGNQVQPSQTQHIAVLEPSVEALTEFAVDTSGFKAEYGQGGGGMITFASKSGTNDFHGTVYEFLRNDDLDARGFFAPTRSVYKQNDFGVATGGPVEIPKLYHGRNRTFFFLSYEGFRNRAGNNGSIMTVPTPEMYQGNFSNWVNSKGQLLQIYDPASTSPNPNGSGFVRNPFPGNQIPLLRFSSVTKEILPYAEPVTPNRPGLVPGTPGYVTNNYISSGGDTVSPADKGSVKIDQNFGFANHLAFLYNRGRTNTGPGPAGPPGLPLPLYTTDLMEFDGSAYRMSDDWTFSPRMINHFSIGGNKMIKDSWSSEFRQNWKSKGVCIPNAVDCNANFPEVTFSEFTSWGAAAESGTEQPSWSLTDALSYIHGAHSVKFGYAFESVRANGFGQQNIAGMGRFSFLETAVPGATSFTSGSSFASFLLGAVDSAATETVRYLPQTWDYHGFYAQDDWRVTNKLTLNIGLRYEFTLPPVSPDGDQYSDFSPTTPNPAVNNYPGALIFAGSGPGRTGKRSLVPGWYGGWGPRLGVAYSVNSKTTIRAGGSRSFGRIGMLDGSSHYAGFSGQYSFVSSDQGITPAFYWDQGLPSYPLPPQMDPAFSNNTSVDYWNGKNSVRPPEALDWTFSIQRQLSNSTVLEADYHAVAGVHLQAGIMNINQVPMSIVNQLIQQYGPTQAIALLNSNISSVQAAAAGIPVPYPNFTNPSVQRAQTVSQALRPYPQYLTIDTSQGGGDKTGHSNYQALLLKLSRRLSGGLTFQWSYALSKLLTDSDGYMAAGGYAEDNGNRRLEKSIGAYDQTHVVKFNTIYELPFGKGKRWLTRGFANGALGGWRLSSTQAYSSGLPLAVSRNATLPIFNNQSPVNNAVSTANNRPWITTYDGWRAPYSGSFDPNADLYLQASAFPVQPSYLLGNATRLNPKVRGFATLNENVSLGKSFNITEQFRLEFRAETFNLLNRTVFSNPNTSLNSTTFGVVSRQANSPRQMQFALKLYW